jgi:uncharacterized glyoxalase superfamily protein PhnB
MSSSKARTVVLGLLSATVYEPQSGNAASEFRGFTLAINYEDAKAVFRAHEELGEFDDIRELDEQPQQSGWGCGFSFRDPEGNVWDVAWKAGSEFDDRGGFIYP